MTNGQKAKILIVVGKIMLRHGLPIKTVINGGHDNDLVLGLMQEGISQTEAQDLVMNNEEVFGWLRSLN